MFLVVWDSGEIKEIDQIVYFSISMFQLTVGHFGCFKARLSHLLSVPAPSAVEAPRIIWCHLVSNKEQSSHQETPNMNYMVVFPAPADREKVKSCLSDLGEMSNSFKQVLNAGMEQLVATVTPRIRPVLDTVATISYELSEAEYAENELNDPWVRKLLHAVETNASWLQPVMTSDNYDLFVHLVIDFIVKRLEVIMMQKRFSQLGGLQLDRDARMLVSHFSSMSNKTVRDKFARLTQMATILNLEKVSEILDFWGENSGPMTWRLTPAEVRRVLGLRIDFKPEAIAALKL
ncbi:hypothetical protein GIB67_034585 [Kingdonia uniflora]|uniref:Conserved oligomeric Golgi complex subunit 4 C-terminal domain-containing protein n=1 Tax=Kingdonia uniflora TaxID=39325 RepID=A0A7J7MXL5_9MAGN|nr:hypothetical protein GIB67_034585 [Kingdonia uniflora]